MLQLPPFRYISNNAALYAGAAVAPPAVPAYPNPGGTGDRTSLIVVTAASLASGTADNLVDGAFGDTSSDAITWAGSVVRGAAWAMFDFGVGVNKCITAFKVYAGTTGTIFATALIQASHDALNWTTLRDIATPFTGSTTGVEWTFPNVGGYRYYRVINTTRTPGTPVSVREIEFNIDNAPKASEFSTVPSYDNHLGRFVRDGAGGIAVTTTAALGSGTINNLVDGGNTGENATADGVLFVGGQTAREIKFDFGVGAQKTITEATWLQNGAVGHGIWKWQRSFDDSSYTDIGSSFALGESTLTTMTSLSANVTACRYYKLVQISGTTSNSVFCFEIEFKIAVPPVPHQVVIVSTAFIAPENATAITTLAASAISPLTWSLVGGADQSKFAIDASSGALSFVAGPDFEIPADADGNNVYEVQVRASDGSTSDTKTISVTVINAPDGPVWAYYAPETLGAGGTSVPQWNDSAGTRHAVQATSANQPVVVASAINGYSAIRLVDGSDRLALPSMTALTRGATFLVLKGDFDGGTRQGFPVQPISIADDGFYPFLDSNVYSGWMKNDRPNCGNPTQALDVWHILSVHSAPSDYRVYINNALLYSSTTSTPTFSATPSIGGPGVSFSYLGHIAEVVQFSHELTTAERNAEYNRLKTKFGL